MQSQNISFQIVKLSPVVKWLIITNMAIWIILQILIDKFILGHGMEEPSPIILYLGMIPQLVIEKGYVWQLFTYMFLHSLNIWHILFNMLSLWFFGAELEYRWGAKFFLTYYLVCGVGAILIYVLGYLFGGLIMGEPLTGYFMPVVGASGCVFGLLVAYAMLFGDRIIYFFGIIPMKAKMFILIYGGIEFFILLTSGLGGPGNTANLAHLGGIITGFVFLWGWTRYQQSKWHLAKTSSKSRRNLRLVVNKDDKNDGPKYWN